MRSLLLALALGGCVDYRFGASDDGATGALDGQDGGADGSGDAPPTEECNGVDDDGDGLVDEGSPTTTATASSTAWTTPAT